METRLYHIRKKSINMSYNLLKKYKTQYFEAQNGFYVKVMFPRKQDITITQSAFFLSGVEGTVYPFRYEIKDNILLIGGESLKETLQ